MKAKQTKKINWRQTLGRPGLSWTNFVLMMAFAGEEDAAWLLETEQPVLFFRY
jgi:hypothetical protein